MLVRGKKSLLYFFNDFSIYSLYSKLCIIVFQQPAFESLV